MDITEPKSLKSAVTGKAFNPDEGYITDADGNHYRISEYSIEADKATDDEGNTPEQSAAE